MKKMLFCFAAVFAVLFGFLVASCSGGADSPNLTLYMQPSGGSSDSGGGTQTTPTPTPPVQQPTETAPTQPVQQPEETNPTTPVTTPTDPSDPATSPDPATPEVISFPDVVELTVDNVLTTIPKLTSNVKKVIVTGEGSNQFLADIGAAIKSNSNISIELDLSEVSNVTMIVIRAFEDCAQLTKIVLPKSSTYDPGLAFKNCTSLKEIVFPEVYTKICSIKELPSLERLVIPSTVKQIFFNEDYVFSNLKYVSTYNSELLKGLNKDSAVETIVLMNSVNNRSFRYTNFKSLKSITIPEGVETVGYQAFYGCTNLTKVVLPETVTSIESNAFYGCVNLSSVNVPSNVTRIGSYAFYGCEGLTSIDIPSNVTRISDYTFMDCSNLSSINIPSKVTYIGKSAFRNCKNVDCELVLPNALEEIGERAFEHCEKLHGTLEIPNSVTKFDDYWTFSYCGFSKVIVPALERIMNPTFAYNENLTEVVLSEGIKTLEGDIFWGCTSLTELTIPESVEEIYGDALGGCDNITKLYVKNHSRYSWYENGGPNIVNKTFYFSSNASVNAEKFKEENISSRIFSKFKK